MPSSLHTFICSFATIFATLCAAWACADFRYLPDDNHRRCLRRPHIFGFGHGCVPITDVVPEWWWHRMEHVFTWAKEIKSIFIFFIWMELVFLGTNAEAFTPSHHITAEWVESNACSLCVCFRANEWSRHSERLDNIITIPVLWRHCRPMHQDKLLAIAAMRVCRIEIRFSTQK